MAPDRAGEDRPQLIIRAATLLDGTGALPVRNAYIHVAGERIVAAGDWSQYSSPDPLPPIVDLGDATLLPGLVDAHVHFFCPGKGIPGDYFATPVSYRAVRSATEATRLLHAGFTSARCLGSPVTPHLAQAIEDGWVEGPRLQAAGEFVCPTGGPWDRVNLPVEWVRQSGMLVDGPDECIRAVRERIRDGSTVIKVTTSSGSPYAADHGWGDGPPFAPGFRADEVSAIVAEAHRHGVRVAAHAIGDAAVRTAIAAGVDTIEHGHYTNRDTKRMMAERQVTLVSTLSLPFRMAYQGHAAGLSASVIAASRRHHEEQLRSLAEAMDLGVTIASGSDLTASPHAPLDLAILEADLLVKAGMTPIQAVIAATRDAAGALGWQDRIGTLEPAKLADIVATEGDVSGDITLLQRIVFVMKGGKTVISRPATSASDARHGS